MQTIPYANLALSFLPVVLVVGIYYRWHLGHKYTLYALLRMVIQLLLIGYVLTFIFKTDHSAVVLGVIL